MRPYPGRGTKLLPRREQIYNYRLSRSRRVIENAFGILVARWRIFHRPMIATVENCERYIKAAMALHNFLRVEDANLEQKVSKYVPPNYLDSENCDGSLLPGEWRNVSTSGVQNSGHLGTNNNTVISAEIREAFADYFTCPAGSLPWQNKFIH